MTLCLCEKLRKQAYADVDNNEKSILQLAHQRAPGLFQTTLSKLTTTPTKRASTSRNPPPKRRPRAKPLPTSPSTASAAAPICQTSSKNPQTSTTGKEPTPILALPFPTLSDPSAPSAEASSEEDKAVINNLTKCVQSSASTPPAFEAINQTVAGRLYTAYSTSTLQKRIICYGFAKHHRKHASYDPIVVDIIKDHKNLEKNPTTRKLKHFVYIGRVWEDILKSLAIDRPHEDYLGFLALVSAHTTWERAEIPQRDRALELLRREKKIHTLSLQATPAVKAFLDGIVGTPFIQYNLSYTSIHCIASTMSPSNGAGIPAASRVESSNPPQTVRDDESGLLCLSSFLAPSDIPLDMLHRGASPRKRWTADGSIESRDSSVDRGLAAFLNDADRVTRALGNLEQKGKISLSPKSYRIVDGQTTQAALAPSEKLFWEKQALLVAYYALSWKNVEPAVLNTQEIQPHVRFVLSPDDNTSQTAKSLPPDVKEDIVLTLVEAVRFPGIGWKLFAVNRAKDLCYNLGNPYIVARITERDSLVSRLSGRVFAGGRSHESSVSDDRRMRVAKGFMAIENALDRIQVEDLSNAEQILDRWEPLQNASLMERAVLLRKHILLGKLKRFQGQFNEALRSLDVAYKLSSSADNGLLNFGEDIYDLDCNHADTLRELGFFEEAEGRLRPLIEKAASASRYRAQMEVSLAECLFAKGHEIYKTQGKTSEAINMLEEARKLCLDLQPRGLLRFERLRTYLTLGKMFALLGDHHEAEYAFAESTKIINKFTLTNGNATMSILKSMIYTLHKLQVQNFNPDRQNALVQSREQLEIFETTAGKDGARHWIPGLKEWEDWLVTQDRHICSRM